MDVLLGILLGIIIGAWGLNSINRKRKSAQIEQQSVVLIEKIKRVCKLISVEGDIAEIYHYEESGAGLFSQLIGSKKAILLVNAKVHVGFDLSQIKMSANEAKKEITLEFFPQPKTLSIETDVKYYDIKNAIFNKFSSSDLTKINREAKQFIADKIPASGLLLSAKKEALDTIKMIEQMIETSGWKLKYGGLELPESNNDQKKLGD